MKIKSVYDNGGKTVDRYTVVFDKIENSRNVCLELSENPDNPQGFSQFGECVEELRLGEESFGKRIKFKNLPKNVQCHVRARIRG